MWLFQVWASGKKKKTSSLRLHLWAYTYYLVSKIVLVTSALCVSTCECVCVCLKKIDNQYELSMVLKLSSICRTSPFLITTLKNPKSRDGFGNTKSKWLTFRKALSKPAGPPAQGNWEKAPASCYGSFLRQAQGLFSGEDLTPRPLLEQVAISCVLLWSQLYALASLSLYSIVYFLMRWETWARGPWSLLWECLVRTYLTRPGGLSFLLFEKTWRGLFYQGHHSSFLQHLGSSAA